MSTRAAPVAVRSIGGGWGEVLADRLGETECRRLETFLAAAWAPGQLDVYPCPGKVFRAFEATSLGSVLAVILGQDPYPNAALACGLAFAVPLGEPRPRSLQRIICAVEKDLLIEVAHDATIEEWTSRGVLLLNTALTYGSADRGGRVHRAAWRPFTRAVLEVLAERSRATEFFLWGAAAKSWSKKVDLGPHVVIAPHPASRYAPTDSRSFAESHPFGPTADIAMWKLHGARSTRSCRLSSPSSSAVRRLPRNATRSSWRGCPKTIR